MTLTRSICLLIALTFAILAPLQQASAADAIAELAALTGQVDILRNGKLPSVEGKVGGKLFVGDFIRTKSNSTAEVLFVDGNRIRIEPRSRVDISSYSVAGDERTIGLARGKVEAVVIPGAGDDRSERPKRFEIQTPNAVAGVRGTTIVVAFQGNITAIHVKKAHSGRSVYSISRAFPGRIVNVPVGGMMWVRHQGAPTLMLPGSDPGHAALMQALAGLGDLGDLQVLVDALSGGYAIPTIFSEAFPEALGVEVGVVDMLTSSPVIWPAVAADYNVDVSMTASFIALSPDSAPVFWSSDNVQIDWTTPQSIPVPFDATGLSATLIGVGPAGDASANFTVDAWDKTLGDWSASISGSGNALNGTSFGFTGQAIGTGADAPDPSLGSSASATGTASGVAIDNTIIAGN